MGASLSLKNFNSLGALCDNSNCSFLALGTNGAKKFQVRRHMEECVTVNVWTGNVTDIQMNHVEGTNAEHLLAQALFCTHKSHNSCLLVSLWTEAMTRWATGAQTWPSGLKLELPTLESLEVLSTRESDATIESPIDSLCNKLGQVQSKIAWWVSYF